MDEDELSRRFDIRRIGADDEGLAESLCDQAWGLARLIHEVVPDGREQALALTALEESMLWALRGLGVAEHETAADRGNPRAPLSPPPTVKGAGRPQAITHRRG